MTDAANDCALKVMDFLVMECRRRKLTNQQELDVMDILIEEFMRTTLEQISINAKETK